MKVINLLCLFLSIGFIMSGEFAHDPSIMYADNMYWLFYTANGIGVKFSNDGVHWNQGVQIFAFPLPWWREYVPDKFDFNIWAPDISYYNGKYHLYYSISTFGSKTSVIGLTQCTDILKGDWVDQGPVLASNPGTPYNAIDPSFVLAHDLPFMVWGSFFGGIYIVSLDRATMKPNGTPKLLATRFVGDNPIEGACVWAAPNGYFYLFASFDRCCRGVDSTYNIRYGRAQNVLGPYLDRDGVDMVHGGGTLLLGTTGNMIGPGGESLFTHPDGRVAMAFHYYDGAAAGVATLGIKGLKLVDDWPALE